MKKQKTILISSILLVTVIVLLSSMLSKKAPDYSNLIYRDGIANETQYKISLDNDRMYKQLEKLKLKDEKAVSPVYAKFLKIKVINRNLGQYIQQLRGELIARAEGIKAKDGDTLSLRLLVHPDDVLSVNALMFGSANNGGAANLKAKFIQLENEINGLPAHESGAKVHILCDECLQRSTGKNESWEEIVFRDRRLIDALITLDSIRMQLTMVENEALHSYVDVMQ